MTENSATTIPGTITELREQLDYGNTALARCKAFTDDIRVFRKKFKCTSGIIGTELYHWRNSTHQSGLEEITHVYLEKEGNGDNFWPKDPTWPNYNKWQYPDHKEYIKTRVKQLIFRMNQQHFRNNKYKNKSIPVSDLQSVGRSKDNPVDVDNAEELLRRLVALRANPSAGVLARPKLEYLESAGGGSASRHSDIWTFPPCSDQSNPSTTKPNASYRAPNRTQDSHGRSQKRTLPAESNDGSTQATKRYKGSRTQAGSDKIHSPGSNAPLKSTIWKSPRTRKTISRPENATAEQVEAAMGSPSMTPTPSRMVNNHFDTLLEEAGNTKRILSSNSSKEKEKDSEIETSSKRSRHTNPNNTKEPTDPRTQEIQLHASKVSPIRMFRDFQTPSEHVESLQDQIIALQPNTRKPNTTEVEVKEPNTEERKPKVEITYRVTQSKSLNFKDNAWTPKGRFQEKTLAELLSEVDAESDVNSLIFTMVIFNAGGLAIELRYQIKPDESGKFEIMKRRFHRGIQGCLNNYTEDGAPLQVEIEIELIKKDAEATLGGDEDFAW